MTVTVLDEARVRGFLEGIEKADVQLGQIETLVTSKPFDTFSVDDLQRYRSAIKASREAREEVDAYGEDLAHTALSLFAANTALEARCQAAEARAEALEGAAKTLHGYSRRYCDGRSTYAPNDHNTATHTLLSLGVELDADPISKTGPFASDGMFGLMAREVEALNQAQAGAHEGGTG
ncbi:hypothetical protein [Deinococcus sp. QL22]|uniref:hypothetical protein n=1 Tax=Deinococcus sp. QL22 TaxID=2939437 RepID=UPI00201801FB|nr:hypothetical protein [Deinococcus sp. QL22]UQN10313.1 hypothetical protein M1R55_29620 [Deinococcus sp. QL22]UQN10447.1 hypothetical protein M1R55_28945 [Deinococcus sp. QL22]